MYSAEIDDVFEVPAQQNIDPHQCGDSYVLGINHLRTADDTGSDILLGERFGLSRQFDVLSMARRYSPQDGLDPLRSAGKFEESKVRNDDDSAPLTEHRKNAGGILAELIVEAAPDHRGINVVTKCHVWSTPSTIISDRP